MILRKPYAFFIKHFRLFHAILVALITLSIIKTKDLLSFFNEYTDTFINLIGTNISKDLISTIFILLPFLIIAICGILITVMILKHKPKIFYIITTCIYIYLIIILFISKSMIASMSIKTIDVKTVMLLRDLISVALVIQFYSLVITFIRTVGFDIKKFDFKKDLKELEISDADREEIEVSFELDKNAIRTKLRKKKRFLKYAYKENKILFYVFGTISVVLIFVLIVIISKLKVPIYNQNKLLNGDNFNVKITNSYITNTDYKGNLIDKDYYFVILKVDIKRNKNTLYGMDIATSKLQIGNYIFTPTTMNKDKMIDFGNIYLDEDISSSYESKALIYEIPKELINTDMIFVFEDKNNKDNYYEKKNFKVAIKPIDLTGISSNIKNNINSVLPFEDSILSNYSIEINAYDIQKEYKISYNFCLNGECSLSYEYLTANINANYDKALLRIKGKLVSNDKLTGIDNLYDFIERFGKIVYVVDGKKKYQNLYSNQITSKKKKLEDTYYIEVNEEVLNATKLSIVFTIRDKTYEYILK